MNAKEEGKRLRKRCGQVGKVDVHEVAALLGLDIDFRTFRSSELDEIKVNRCIAVSHDLGELARRWAIAHAIGHQSLHSSNRLWLRAHTLLSDKLERQAETFAYNLLVNEAEILSEGLKTTPEIAAYFGIPAEMVQVQGRLV